MSSPVVLSIGQNATGTPSRGLDFIIGSALALIQLSACTKLESKSMTKLGFEIIDSEYHWCHIGRATECIEKS
jgi:hypothetical protein